ncbi:MAG: hypothetical protein GY931_04665 [Maribacter sp.]|nr:hypothetical protein [Maribacter sp.]
MNIIARHAFWLGWSRLILTCRLDKAGEGNNLLVLVLYATNGFHPIMNRNGETSPGVIEAVSPLNI